MCPNGKNPGVRKQLERYTCPLKSGKRTRHILSRSSTKFDTILHLGL